MTTDCTLFFFFASHRSPINVLTCDSQASASLFCPCLYSTHSRFSHVTSAQSPAPDQASSCCCESLTKPCSALRSRSTSLSLNVPSSTPLNVSATTPCDSPALPAWMQSSPFTSPASAVLPGDAWGGFSCSQSMSSAALPVASSMACNLHYIVHIILYRIVSYCIDSYHNVLHHSQVTRHGIHMMY